MFIVIIIKELNDPNLSKKERNQFSIKFTKHELFELIEKNEHINLYVMINKILRKQIIKMKIFL